MHCCRIVNVIKNKNLKNSLGATWNASHLVEELFALRHWKRVSMPPTTQSLRHPLSRAIHVAPRLFFMFFVSVPPAFTHWTVRVEVETDEDCDGLGVRHHTLATAYWSIRCWLNSVFCVDSKTKCEKIIVRRLWKTLRGILPILVQSFLPKNWNILLKSGEAVRKPQIVIPESYNLKVWMKF